MKQKKRVVIGEDGVGPGDTFNAYIREGVRSKTNGLRGKGGKWIFPPHEAAGKLDCHSPQVATAVNEVQIQTEDYDYARRFFDFVKVE